MELLYLNRAAFHQDGLKVQPMMRTRVQTRIQGVVGMTSEAYTLSLLRANNQGVIVVKKSTSADVRACSQTVGLRSNQILIFVF